MFVNDYDIVYCELNGTIDFLTEIDSCMPLIKLVTKMFVFTNQWNWNRLRLRCSVHMADQDVELDGK